MKKALMIAAITLMGATAVTAQDKVEKTPAERAKMQTERMTKELELTPEQAAKISTINAGFAEKVEAMREKRKAERTEMKEQKIAEAKAIRDAHNKELQSVLTPEQFAKWETLKEDRKEKHQEHRKEMDGKGKGHDVDHDGKKEMKK